MNARDRTWNALFDVVDRRLPTFRATTIFDVGANVGETAETFSLRFPNATIHAFEPVSASFGVLADRSRSQARIHCHQIALSDQSSTAWMEVPEKTKQARIVSYKERVAGAEEVQTGTGDAFRSDRDIDMVDFLKIDTEGHDLAVLRGFEKTLASQKVGLIDVEVGLAPGNDRHVPLNTVQEYLEELGYPLFWLHERTLDLYFSGRPILRRVNAVFVSSDLVKVNTTRPGKQVSSMPARAPMNSRHSRPLRRRVRRALRLR